MSASFKELSISHKPVDGSSKSSIVILVKPLSQKEIVMNEPNINARKTEDSVLKGKGKVAIQIEGLSAESLSVPPEPKLDLKTFPHSTYGYFDYNSTIDEWVFKKYVRSESPTSQTNKKTENEVSEGRMDLSTDHPSEEPSSSNQSQGEIIIYGATADECYKTDGQEIILGAIDAQPISSIPTLSKIDGTEAYTIKEGAKLVSQLAQSVGTHIRRSDNETTSLRTELRESVSTIEAKLDVNSTIVEKIEDKLNRLTEILLKETQKRTEEVAAREDRKRKRKEEKQKEKEEKKKKKDE